MVVRFYLKKQQKQYHDHISRQYLDVAVALPLQVQIGERSEHSLEQSRQSPSVTRVESPPRQLQVGRQIFCNMRELQQHGCRSR